MELAFGAGSVPCKQQPTMSMDIELAPPTIQAGTCHSGLPSRVRCSVFWPPFSPWQFFADDPQRPSNRGLRDLNESVGICVSLAISAVQHFFKAL
jgi:hypothetical protein